MGPRLESSQHCGADRESIACAQGARAIQLKGRNQSKRVRVSDREMATVFMMRYEYFCGRKRSETARLNALCSRVGFRIDPPRLGNRKGAKQSNRQRHK